MNVIQQLIHHVMHDVRLHLALLMLWWTLSEHGNNLGLVMISRCQTSGKINHIGFCPMGIP